MSRAYNNSQNEKWILNTCNNFRFICNYNTYTYEKTVWKWPLLHILYLIGQAGYMRIFFFWMRSTVVRDVLNIQSKAGDQNVWFKKAKDALCWWDVVDWHKYLFARTRWTYKFTYSDRVGYATSTYKEKVSAQHLICIVYTIFRYVARQKQHMKNCCISNRKVIARKIRKAYVAPLVLSVQFFIRIWTNRVGNM